jgi:UDP-glucose 4-epimerase
MTRYFLVGGAGFIGSHLARRLSAGNSVTIYDNFSSGRMWRLGDAKVTVVRGDVKDLARAHAGHARMRSSVSFRVESRHRQSRHAT